MKSFSTQILAAAFAVATASFASGGSLSPPLGPPSPTMKSLDELDPAKVIKTLPYTIDTSGTYRVAANLSSSSSGITITASDVVLDLDGHVLTGQPGSTNGIYIAPACKGVRVRNGGLHHWGECGLRCDAPDDSDGDGLEARACGTNGFQVNGATLTRCVAVENGQTGIAASPSPGNPFRCMDGTCARNGSHGISVSVTAAGATELDISSTRCDSNGTIGTGSGVHVALDNPGAKLVWSPRSNVCRENASSGVSVDVGFHSACDLSATDCDFSSNLGSGLDVSDQGRGAPGSRVAISVSSSTCNNNGTDGLSVVRASASSGTLQLRAFGTFCDGNSAGRGIHVSSPPSSGAPGGVSLTDCQASNNGLEGARIVHRDLACRNVLVSRNGQALLCDGVRADCDDGNATIEDSSFSGNSGCGLHVTGAVGVCRRLASANNGLEGCFVETGDATVEQVTSVGNGASGIRRKGWDGLIYGTHRSTRIDSSRCSSNGGEGLEIEAGVASVSVLHTECSANARSGIRHKGWDGTIKGNMRVESSSCSSNGGEGLELDAGVASVAIAHTECSSNGRSGIRHKGWDGTIKGTMRIESSRCSSNGVDGVEIDPSPVSVSLLHTECSSNARGGIRTKGWDGTVKGRVDMEACRLVSNGASGLQVDGPDEDCDGRDMVVSGNGGTGIDIGPGAPLQGSVSLSGSTSSGNGAGGISLRAVHGGALHRCVADGNTSDGIALDGPFFSVADNRATNNSLSGIRVLSGSSSEVSRNYLSGNENGLHVASTGNSVHGNSGSGNTGSLLSGNPANDIAPSSTAATATSPVGNLEF